jgi:hypothetical protein
MRSLAAVNAPAKVEFASSVTITRFGFCFCRFFLGEALSLLFVVRGFHCLRLGLLSGLVGGVLRRIFLSSPNRNADLYELQLDRFVCLYSLGE